jgi:hypothetical protein
MFRFHARRARRLWGWRSVESYVPGSGRYSISVQRGP